MVQENTTEDVEGGISSPSGSADTHEAQDDHEEEVSGTRAPKTAPQFAQIVKDLVLLVARCRNWAIHTNTGLGLGEPEAPAGLSPGVPVFWEVGKREFQRVLEKFFPNHSGSILIFWQSTAESVIGGKYQLQS